MEIIFQSVGNQVMEGGGRRAKTSSSIAVNRTRMERLQSITQRGKECLPESAGRRGASRSPLWTRLSKEPTREAK